MPTKLKDTLEKVRKLDKKSNSDEALPNERANDGIVNHVI